MVSQPASRVQPWLQRARQRLLVCGLAMTCGLSQAQPQAFDPSLLLDWAERTHSALFPGPQPDQQSGPLLYRTYPATGHAVGVAGSTVYVQPAGGAVTAVGTLADFECAVLPHRCADGGTQARARAAQAVADTHPDCTAIHPFHWSVGDAGGPLAEGQAGGATYQSGTVMAIASASKWLYGAYVAQKRQGELQASDVPFLNFTSGYTEFDQCLPSQTLGACQAYQGMLIKNGAFVAQNEGRFFYSGGHMQKHGVNMGLGDMDNAALGREVSATLGIELQYASPQPAGGGVTSAAQYGQFLQKMVAGRLQLSRLLGTHAVCTDPGTSCPSAVSTPLVGRNFHYSLGHWVEDDPAGDGAFSSAGAFGFYPWIDAGRSWWGVIARHDSASNQTRAGYLSAQCGAWVRKAWLSPAANM